MSDQPKAAPFQCTSCSAPLPITPSQAQDSVPLVCMCCGARYQGKLWKHIPEALKGNVKQV